MVSPTSRRQGTMLLCLNKSANAVRLVTQIHVQMLTGLVGNPSERILFAIDTERALRHLDPQQRQILTLSTATGTTPPDAPRYLAIDTRTARKRLVTANAALLDLGLAPERTPSGWTPTTTPTNKEETPCSTSASRLLSSGKLGGLVGSRGRSGSRLRARVASPSSSHRQFQRGPRG